FDGGRAPWRFDEMVYKSPPHDPVKYPREFWEMVHRPESWHKTYKRPDVYGRGGEPGGINTVFADGHAVSLPCSVYDEIPLWDPNIRSWIEAWVKSRWRTNGS
ncbi:unnamed protein product, partial [marine sediment metagenome]